MAALETLYFGLDILADGTNTSMKVTDTDITVNEPITMLNYAAAAVVNPSASNAKLFYDITSGRMHMKNSAGDLGTFGINASTTEVGVIQLATDAEAIAGTANDKALTPAALAAAGGLKNKGAWDASTNTSPNLADGIGVNGDWYRVSTGGSTSLDGINVWHVGDIVYFDGSFWRQISNASVGQTLTQQSGGWDAATNNPNLAVSSPSGGNFYVVTVGGNTALGGFTYWQEGDIVWYDGFGSVWRKIDNSKPDFPVITFGNRKRQVARSASAVAFAAIAEDINFTVDGFYRLHLELVSTSGAADNISLDGDYTFYVDSDTPANSIFKRQKQFGDVPDFTIDQVGGTNVVGVNWTHGSGTTATYTLVFSYWSHYDIADTDLTFGN